MSAVLDNRQRSRVAKEVSDTFAVSLTPDTQWNLILAFLTIALLNSNTQPFENLGNSVSPELLLRLNEIDPNFSPKVCLQELTRLGQQATIDLVLKQVWKYIEVTKQTDSYRSRKDAFEVLHEGAKDEVASLLAKLSAYEYRNQEYLQRILALERELKDATGQCVVTEFSKAQGTSVTDESTLKWKQAADEWQRRFEDIEARYKEEVASTEQTVEQLRKQLEEWESGRRHNGVSHAVHEHELEVTKLQKELSGFKEKAGGLVVMCTQYKAQIEKLLIENATLTSQLTAVENRQEMSKTYDVSTLLKENANLRAALKTVEQMKMELENEKVAVQDQLLEYQRRCGVFNKPLPPSATYKTASNRAVTGKARAFADGIIRATVTSSVRICPFCQLEFEADQFGSNQNDFMDHVISCQAFSLSETF